MTIDEAWVAGCAGASVLMCYDTEDEKVNDMIALELLCAGFVEASLNKYTFDGGGSVKFLLVDDATSDKWNEIHFDEGNALARVTFPGAFKDVL